MLTRTSSFHLAKATPNNLTMVTKFEECLLVKLELSMGRKGNVENFEKCLSSEKLLRRKGPIFP